MSQWQLLVTEGHVRAARWRNVAPFVFAAGVAAVIIGIAIMAYLPKPESSTQVLDAQNAYAQAQRLAVAAFLQDKGVIAQAPPDAVRAITRDAAPEAVAALLGSLNEHGRLPESIHAVDAGTFWRGDWRPGTITAVQKDRTVLIGYLVDTSYRYPGYRAPPMLRRAFGIFRRGDTGRWTFHCLALRGAQPCESEAVDPSTIPATMRELLPAEAFARGGQS